MDGLSLVVLTGSPRGNAARISEFLAQSSDSHRIVGAIVDGGSPDRKRQLSRLAAWRRQGGLSYAGWRIWLESRGRLRRPPATRYPRSLYEIGHTHGFPVVEVPSVNSDMAKETLTTMRAELGLSIGNRVIQKEVFSIPEHGVINLHHGRVPDYRGGPPAFWELFNREPEMGVTVHQIDDQLDHGPVLAAGAVPVLPGDDPKTLMERTYTIDFMLVAEALDAIANGRRPLRVDAGDSAVRTLPTRRQLRELSARIGKTVGHDDFRRARLPTI